MRQFRFQLRLPFARSGWTATTGASWAIAASLWSCSHPVTDSDALRGIDRDGTSPPAGGAPGVGGSASVAVAGALASAGNGEPPAGPPPAPNTGGSSSGAAGTGPVAPANCDASYEAEALTPSTGEPVAEGWNIYTLGTLSGSHTFRGGPSKLTVYARGNNVGGAWPHMVVRAGGKTVGELDVTAESWTPYPFDVTLAAGQHTFEVEFTNDFQEGEADRNLYVDKVHVSESCDGSAPSPGPGAGGASNPGAGGSANPGPGNGGSGNGAAGGGNVQGPGAILEANPFTLPIFLDPELPAIEAEQRLRSGGSAADADLMKKLATSPQADWIGEWSGDVAAAVQTAVQAAGNSLRVLVAYNIYNRDCGGASGGGVADANEYKAWIDAFASGIGTFRAAIILEPDALSHECDQSRWDALSYAVSSLKKNAGVRVYIDAGHSNWLDAGTMASRLKIAGIDKADGFSLNVSNYQTTSASIGYGTEISGQVGNKPFVIDTSRNGKGPMGGEWCNPPGRGLGEKPTANTGNPLVHAFLWIKRPGESDGPCNGGPAAGQWFESYALELARNAVF